MQYVVRPETEQAPAAQTVSDARPRSRRRRKAQQQQLSREILRRAALPALGLEGLEQRTLLSTLPTPTITTHTDVSGGGTDVNQSAPSISYDPSTPQKLVTVYTSNQPDATGEQRVFIQGRYSNNGGATWNTFSIPGNIFDPNISTAADKHLYSRATDASVGFDLHDNFYVAYSEHGDDYNDGAIVATKWSFSGNAPIRDQNISSKIVYQWAAHDGAFTPTLAVDTNQANFVDPETNAPQKDLGSNNIYIAWMTDTKAATNVSNFNPNSIILVSSNDAGKTFSSPTVMSHGTGSERDGYPKIAVSQGTSDGRVAPGLVTVIWDDFGSGHFGNTPTDTIRSNSIGGSGNNLVSDTTGGDVADALPGNPSTPTTTDFPLTVNVADPNFLLTDLDVSLSLHHDNLGDLSVLLVDPNGNSVELFHNKINEDGSTNQNQGLNGQDMGLVNNFSVPTSFDDQAARSIADASAQSPFIGSYRPIDPNGLAFFNGYTQQQVNGAWKLRIIDHHSGNVGHLFNWSLNLKTGAQPNPGDKAVATTRVLGANPKNAFPLNAAVSPDRGIGPGAVIASDNTLGSFSPYQGRLYVAYTNWLGSGTGNPADNTDIWLATSDDGGSTWTAHGRINDDEALSDGFSEASDGPKVRGRAQFMPSVAVDQVTGTLVMTWYDGRYDPSRTQVSQFIGTSLDGGSTWSQQTFLNQPNQVTDAITGTQHIRGPVPDNVSNNNPNRESTYGLGTHQDVVAVAGHIYPVWSGNLNGGIHGDNLLHIYTAGVVTAAGPRIVSSTMGPVSQSGDALNPAAADGSPKFSKFKVVFDRPIDPASFTASSVQVFYRSPTTVGTAPGTPVAVTTVAPTDLGVFGPAGAAGATTFLVQLTTPQTAVGTYSYFITPDMHDRVRNLGATVVGSTTASYAAAGNQINLRLPPTGTGGAGGDGVAGNPIDLTTSTINVSGVDPASVISKLKVNVSLTHTFDFDLALTLIAPDGRRILLSSNNGGAGANYTNTTFDDNAGTSIVNGSAPFTGSFIPEDALNQLDGLNPNGDWKLEIDDQFAIDTGTLSGWSLTVTSGVPGPGIGNFDDQNANAITAEPASGLGSGDVLAVPTPTSAGAFNGTYFLPPFTTDTQPIMITGPHVVSTHVNGNPITDDNLVLNKTVSSIDVVFDRPMDPTTVTAASVVSMTGPVGALAGPFTITQNPLGTDQDPAHPKTYRINFPAQTLSGTYVLTLSSSIKSKNGDSLDTNLNAGLDALRDISSDTVDVVATSSDTPQPIGAKVAQSSIDVSDSFLISKATLTLNITYANDPDLTATLIAPDGTQIPLFSKVGAAGASKANFQNTVFDDAATTPIQNGAAPFFGKFNPQLPLSTLIGRLAKGKWTLRVQSSGVLTGTLNSWSLSLAKPVPGTGVGELAADQATASFRIFTMDVANPQSHNTWTAIGGASNNDNSNSGRIGGLALDPSDPSGNTVYAAGASGGIWKTRNFLTTAEQGPTWIPLTDFGPTTAINIGSIAAFGQNNDTNQTILFAATGEGDTGSQGVGFLRSSDGGANWTLLDSTTNVDAQGNPLPINSPQRDHAFVGSSAFKILIDPKPAPSGDVIVYAALSGANGGVWRSLDSGKHWTNMSPVVNNVRLKNCTDIVLDLKSGFFDALNNPNGNLQYLYAAFQGSGVYFSPNRGTVWNPLLGTTGDPLIRDNTNPPPTAVQVSSPNDTPNTGGGRISLAKPALSGNELVDVQYQGWLYALVANADGSLHGVYETKDFGQTWTKIRMPITAADQPSNDIGNGDIPVFGVGTFNLQGNYDQSIAVDPNNPAVIYVGGTHDGTPTGFVRVDTTFVHDAHSFYEDSSSNSNFGLDATNNPVVLKGWPGTGSVITNPPFLNAVNDPYINLIRDPRTPFLANASVNVIHADSFTNDGGGASWIPFDIEGTDQHRIITMVDPLTGKTRIIVGDDQGIYSAVDDNGKFLFSFGNQTLPDASRNGNIQITQFYYGAIQPSNLAAQVAGALFYGQAQDDGALQSASDVLSTGNITWVGPEGDGTGVATDQTGTGTAYRYNWPCCNGLSNSGVGAGPTDFFMVTPPGSAPGTGISRTFGLIQDSQGGNTPDPQWPFLGGSSFAVNPISADQIIISSQKGRIFGTANQGRIWTEIGNPTALDSTYAPALAYGAPDPASGQDATNFFLYAGTSGGHIFVTFNGGGASGNDWIEISNGLDGSSVQAIVTNPLRGSHEAYAVTAGGVYYMSNSAAANPSWQKISGNLFNIQHSPFGDSSLGESQLQSLTSIVADWRYAIPDNLNNPTGPSHPVLYVAGEGGVYRSFDKGSTWHLFPDSTIDGAPANGGYLPNAHVSDLDLGVGNIDPTTGMPKVADSPDTLLATTYGRSSFGIRIAPTVVPSTLKLVGTPKLQQPLTISGISEISAFGNKVHLTLYDLTSGTAVYKAGWNPNDPVTTDTVSTRTDVKGNFSLNVAANVFGPGTRIIGVYLTDDAGVVSQSTITFPPGIPSVPDLDPASDTGSSQTDNLTKDNTPTFIGTADAGTKVTIFSDGIAVGNSLADSNGNYSVTTSALSSGNHNITATSTDVASNVQSTPSAALQITIDLAAPAQPSAPDLIDASDSGASNSDNITNIINPTFTGTAEKGAIVTLFDGQTQIGTATADANTGAWSILSSTLAQGSHTITAKATDAAGNVSANSSSLTVNIDVINPASPSVPDLLASSDDGASDTDNITTDQTPTFSGTADPSTAIDLLADGNVVGTGQSDVQGKWQITTSGPLGGGSYSFTARARDVAGNVSQPSVGLVVQINAPLPPPSVPDLTNASDSGASNTDNITNINKPTFTGTGPLSTTVELYSDNVLVGSIATDAQGKWSITLANALTDGQHNITARSNNGTLQSVFTNALQVTIDTQTPAAPSTPVLDPSSDTGTLGDNSTADTTPTYNGTGPASTIIDLLVNNTVFGTGQTDGQGKWQITSSGIPKGSYVVTARSRDLAGNLSSPSGGVALTITTNSNTTGVITNFTLVNADTGQDIMDLTEGVQLDLSQLPAHLAIRANPNPTTVGSVKFGYDPTAGQFNANYRTESLLPYALFADSNNGTKYNAGTFTQGNHTLTGTCFSGTNGAGTAGSTTTLHFSVTNGVVNQNNTVTSFSLINADNGQVVKTMVEGETLDLSTLPAHLSMRANTNPSKVGSVKFNLDGSLKHTESSGPYSLNGDNSGASYTPVTFANGSHTLTAQVFSGSGGSGSAQGSLTLHFNVTGSVNQQQNTVTSFSLINADTGAVIRTLVENDTINRASLPAHLSIRANTNPGKVGSVVFGYDSNAKFHTESAAPYSMNGDNNGTTYTAVTFTAGAHTLVGTVWSASGGTGTKQGSLTLHFTVS